MMKRKRKKKDIERESGKVRKQTRLSLYHPLHVASTRFFLSSLSFPGPIISMGFATFTRLQWIYLFLYNVLIFFCEFTSQKS